MRRGGQEVQVLTTEMDSSAAVLPCYPCGSRRGRWRPPARHRPAGMSGRAVAAISLVGGMIGDEQP